MNIYWSEFTPYSSLLGGMLIGLAATILLLGLGRIAGVAGILDNIFNKPVPDQATEWQWRLAFVFGLICAPIIYSKFTELPSIRLNGSWLQMIIAGLLVGVGTRLGSGCTSGHGICGLARLSLRSLVATLCFMISGFATVFILHHFA